LHIPNPSANNNRAKFKTTLDSFTIRFEGQLILLLLAPLFNKADKTDLPSRASPDT
jgi:hypothetical protein